jgi:hypothetical protein
MYYFQVYNLTEFEYTWKYNTKFQMNFVTSSWKTERAIFILISVHFWLRGGMLRKGAIFSQPRPQES